MDVEHSLGGYLILRCPFALKQGKPRLEGEDAVRVVALSQVFVGPPVNYWHVNCFNSAS